MRISEVIGSLKKFKKERGDLEVLLDLNNIQDNSGHGEYTHEADFSFKIEKIHKYDADIGRMSKSKRNVLSVFIDL